MQVAAVVREAAVNAIQEDADIERVEKRHFEAALSSVTPRISEESLRLYEQFAANSRLHSV